MSKRLFSMGVLAVAILASPGLLRADDAAKEGAEASSSETKATKSRGDEKHDIAEVSSKNDPKATIEAPATKGGAKDRGCLCRLTFDNWTPWKIQAFVDREYVGLIAPFGELSGWRSCGSHRLFGLAEFTDGPDLTWGAINIRCSGAYTWKLDD